MTRTTITASALIIAASAGSALAQGFTDYVIRDAATQILPNTDYVPNGLEFVISVGGMKAGLGSDYANGYALGSITQMAITRHDDTTRFAAGSGPAVAPYFNIWVTDGLGNFAVVANEPSNPSFAAFRTSGPGNGITYDFSMADIANEPVQVYETPNGGFNSTNTWVHNLVGINGPLTFADISGLTVGKPSPSYITDPGNAVGGGAPRELGTNLAYGFNWVFGDTLTNYVSGMEGYVVSGATLVPTPASAALLGFAGLAAARRRR